MVFWGPEPYFFPKCKTQNAKKDIKSSEQAMNSIIRRKKIYNNLKNYLKDSERAKKVLDDLKIEYNKRPEDISPLLFLDIYKNVKLL